MPWANKRHDYLSSDPAVPEKDQDFNEQSHERYKHYSTPQKSGLRRSAQGYQRLRATRKELFADHRFSRASGFRALQSNTNRRSSQLNDGRTRTLITNVVTTVIDYLYGYKAFGIPGR